MDIPEGHAAAVGRKLVELMAALVDRNHPFNRYWALVGPVHAFSESAARPIEHEVAKALQDALEEVLRREAPIAWDTENAPAVAEALGLKHWREDFSVLFPWKKT
jgi:hypothetical protein